MAKQVKDEALQHGNRRGRYDGDNWLNSKTWELTQGEDFDIDITSMRSTIYSKAKERGLKVTTARKEIRLYLRTMKR